MDPDCSIIDGSDFSSTTDQKMMNNEAERETEQTSSNPKKRPHSPSVHTSNKQGKHNDHSHPNSSRLDLHQHQTDDLIDVHNRIESMMSTERRLNSSELSSEQTHLTTMNSNDQNTNTISLTNIDLEKDANHVSIEHSALLDCILPDSLANIAITLQKTICVYFWILTCNLDPKRLLELNLGVPKCEALPKSVFRACKQFLKASWDVFLTSQLSTHRFCHFDYFIDSQSRQIDPSFANFLDALKQRPDQLYRIYESIFDSSIGILEANSSKVGDTHGKENETQTSIVLHPIQKLIILRTPANQSAITNVHSAWNSHQLKSAILLAKLNEDDANEIVKLYDSIHSTILDSSNQRPGKAAKSSSAPKPATASNSTSQKTPVAENQNLVIYQNLPNPENYPSESFGTNHGQNYHQTPMNPYSLPFQSQVPQYPTYMPNPPNMPHSPNMPNPPYPYQYSAFPDPSRSYSAPNNTENLPHYSFSVQYSTKFQRIKLLTISTTQIAQLYRASGILLDINYPVQFLSDLGLPVCAMCGTLISAPERQKISSVNLCQRMLEHLNRNHSNLIVPQHLMDIFASFWIEVFDQWGEKHPQRIISPKEPSIPRVVPLDNGYQATGRSIYLEGFPLIRGIVCPIGDTAGNPCGWYSEKKGQLYGDHLTKYHGIQITPKSIKTTLQKPFDDGLPYLVPNPQLTKKGTQK